MPPIVGQTYNTWEAILSYLDTPTGDGRQLASEGMTVRELPLTLLFMPATDDGHDGAYPMGRIDKVWVDGDKLMGSGIVDSSPEAQEAARMVAEGIQREVSIDPAPSTYTYRFPLDYDEQIVENGDGTESVEVTESNEDYLVIFQEWELTGATVVSGAAFSGTQITITADALDSREPIPLLAEGTEIRVDRGFTAAALDDPSGAFIALFPDDPSGLAVDGGETAENLHVTLIAGIDTTDGEMLDSLVSDLASQIAPLSGVVGGAGLFGASDQGTPIILLADVPELDDAHQAIDDVLDAATIGFAEEHGFVPHITVAYAAEGEAVPLPTTQIGAALAFSTLSLVNGDQREDYPLAGAAVEEDDIEAGVTASAAGMVPEHPPAEWLADPEFTEPTPMHFGDDGRVYGHAALFGVCHTGLSGRCLSLDQLRSRAAYAYFHTGYVVTAEGEKVRVGQITIGTDHPSTGIRDPQVVAQHYANTGTCAADVRVGEDEFGLWVAGAIRPDFPANRLRELRGACLSGDWRPINRAAELMALLAVNVPGYPVVAPEALVASGETQTLSEPISAIAVGMTLPGDFDARDEARGEQRLAALRAAGRGLEGLREAAGLPG